MTVEELEAENARLRAQVTDLQATGTRLVEERRANDLHCQVYEFQRRWDIPTHSVPAVPDEHRVRSRLLLSTEEHCEQLQACFRFNPALEHALLDEVRYAKLSVNLPAIVDAWGDSNYITEGSAICFGVDMKPIAREIHRANLAKRDGGTMRADGKIIKPPGWKPPDIAKLLRQQGWQG